MLRTALAPIATAVATAIATGLLASAASAATYRIDATSLLPSEISDFSIVYDDIDGDTIFSLPELISFSGVVLQQPFPVLFPILQEAAEVPGIATGGSAWIFSLPNATTALPPPGFFRYLVSPASVPLPAAGLMLAGAMAILAVARRRRS